MSTIKLLLLSLKIYSEQKSAGYFTSDYGYYLEFNINIQFLLNFYYSKINYYL